MRCEIAGVDHWVRAWGCSQWAGLPVPPCGAESLGINNANNIYLLLSTFYVLHAFHASRYSPRPPPKKLVQLFSHFTDEKNKD